MKKLIVKNVWVGNFSQWRKYNSTSFISYRGVVLPPFHDYLHGKGKHVHFIVELEPFL